MLRRDCQIRSTPAQARVLPSQGFHGDWDHHADINGHKFTSRQVDQPIAALVRDLKPRDMRLTDMEGHVVKPLLV
jgi:hypothetical protein